MPTDQNSVASLLSPEIIRKLAKPADLRYGQAIHARQGVKFIAFEPQSVEAWVGGLNGSVIEGGSQRRRTRLNATPEGLAWQCAGNPKNHQVFCKHCVALALAILDQQAGEG